MTYFVHKGIKLFDFQNPMDSLIFAGILGGEGCKVFSPKNLISIPCLSVWRKRFFLECVKEQ